MTWLLMDSRLSTLCDLTKLLMDMTKWEKLDTKLIFMSLLKETF